MPVFRLPTGFGVVRAKRSRCIWHPSYGNLRSGGTEHSISRHPLCFTRQERNPTTEKGVSAPSGPKILLTAALPYFGSTFKAEGSAGTFLHRWTEHYGRKQQAARRKMQDARSRVAHQWGISGCKIATGPLISPFWDVFLVGIASGPN